MEPSSFISGTITTNGGTVSLPTTSGLSGVLLQLSGTWSATVVVEVSVDNTNWTQVLLVQYQNSVASPVTSVSANGLYSVFPFVGAKGVRARTTSYTSGTVSVFLDAFGTPTGADYTSIISDVSTTVTTGAKSSIGTSAVQLTATSIPVYRGVEVKAANDNSGIVYVGTSSGVTNGTTDATDGFELGAGESILIPITDASLVYIIGSASGQKVFFTAQ